VPCSWRSSAAGRARKPLIDDINRDRLDFVLHVGDIGDNEWLDCREPLVRLAAWRRYFCDVPIAVERQQGEYCEHMRWVMGGFLFVALNVQGSNNNPRLLPSMRSAWRRRSPG
jgi:hypothetical protein